MHILMVLHSFVFIRLRAWEQPDMGIVTSLSVKKLPEESGFNNYSNK